MTTNTQTSLQPDRRPLSPHWRDHRRPVVLIVEDHDDTREMLQILLSGYGCHVIPAENGQRALDLAEQLHPDVILMDMKLPVLDGLTVTRIVRSRPNLNQIPIVAVTGMDTPEFQREALDAGCNYCLGKPFEFERLEKLIRMLTHSASEPVTYEAGSVSVRSRGVICSYQHLH